MQKQKLSLTKWCAGFALVLTVGSLGLTPVHAAGYASADGSSSKKKDEKNEYPNTTRKDPKNDLSEKASKDLNKAYDLLDKNKFDEAQVLFEKVAADSHSGKYGQAKAIQGEAQIKQEKEDYDGAIVLDQQAIDLNAMPNREQFQVMYQVAQLQLQQEKYQDVLTSLDAWQKATNTEKADVYALRGNAYYRLEKYPQAIEALNKANSLADKPSDSWTEILMASYFETQQYDEAGKIAQAQLAKDPNNLKLIQRLAAVYINAKQDQKALELLSGAKSKGLITTEDDYKHLAQLYANADKPKDGAPVLEEGLSKGIVKPTYDNYKLLGDMYAQGEDDTHALAAYAKASPLAKDGNVDYQRGYILFYSDHSKDAKEAFSQAISKGGLRQQGEAYLLRGDAENDLNENAAAIADYEKATGFPSSKPMADQRLKALRGGVKIQKKKK